MSADIGEIGTIGRRGASGSAPKNAVPASGSSGYVVGDPPDLRLLLMALAREGRNPKVIPWDEWRKLTPSAQEMDWIIVSQETYDWWIGHD